MTTTAASPSPTSTPNRIDGATVLDRRRDTWQTAQRAATAADTELSTLAERLAANTRQRGEYDTALRAAMKHQAELKTAIKAAAKEHDRLRDARKQAGRTAAKAQRDAKAAESKYDKTLLADMLRQQKRTDLAAHDGSAKPATARTPRRRTAAARQPADTAVATAASATKRRATATRRTAPSR